MATYYSDSGTCGGSSRRLYRAELTVTTTDYTAYVAVSWSASVTMYNASQYGVGISCEGKTNSGYLSSANSSGYSTVASVNGSFNIDKGASSTSRKITATAYGETVNGYGGADGSVSVSHTISIPALPIYTISYNSNSGTGTMSTDTVQYNSNYYTKANTFTKIGYSWDGWNEEANGSGTDWTDWVGKAWKWTYTQNVTLYAQWKANEYSITLDPNQGTVTIPTVFVIYDAEENNQLQAMPIRPGCEFLGWYDSLEGGTQVYDAKGFCTNDGTYWDNYKYAYPNNITLYAHWKFLNVAYYKQNNKYVLCNTYGKVNGSWKPMLFYGKINGTWKQSIIEE